MVYMISTDRLLDVCENSCQNKTLSAKVNDTKKQSVKNQQRRFISIKQHIFEGEILICNDKPKETCTDCKQYKRTYTHHCIITSAKADTRQLAFICLIVDKITPKL